MSLVCPECGAKMVLKTSKYGPFYGCVRYPECDGTHGAHANSGKPLGIPADKETKEWRIKAHDKFDSMWKMLGYKRSEAYQMLSDIMKLSKDKAHISMFDIEQCKKLISLLDK